MSVILQAVLHVLNDHKLEEIMFLFCSPRRPLDLQTVSAVGMLRLRELIRIDFVQFVKQSFQRIVPIQNFLYFTKFILFLLLLKIGLRYADNRRFFRLAGLRRTAGFAWRYI